MENGVALTVGAVRILMPTQDQWNERYRRGEHAQDAPDAFVVGCSEYWELLGSRVAADLAGGAGRHAAFLAEHGFQTTAIDFAEAALEATQKRAAGRGADIETRMLDLEAPDADLGAEAFDLIVVVHQTRVTAGRADYIQDLHEGPAGPARRPHKPRLRIGSKRVAARIRRLPRVTLRREDQRRGNSRTSGPEAF